MTDLRAPAHLAPPGLRRRLSAIIALMRKETLLHRRDPLLLIMLFVVPVVLTVFLSSALGGGFTLSNSKPSYLAIGQLPADTVAKLGHPARTVSLATAEKDIASGKAEFGVMAEPGGHLRIIADPASPSVVPDFLSSLSQANVQLVAPNGSSYRKAASPYQQTLVGFAILNVFFAGAHAAQALHRERNWGTWNRVLSLRLSKAEILLGTMLPMAAIAALQGVILIIAGGALVGIPIDRPGFALLGVALLGVVVASAGVLLAAVAKNDMQVPQFNNLLTLLGGAMSGAMVSIALMPSWAKHVAPIFPQYWALDMIKGAMSRGAPTSRLIRDAAMLVGYAVLFAGVGTWRMKWEKFRHE